MPSRGFGEVGETLDAQDLVGEPSEQRRLPAVAGADLQDALVAFEAEGLDHARDERWLCRHLLMRDRNRSVEVGQVGVLQGNELGARHGRDRLQYALVPHTCLASRCDQRLHVASMRLCPLGRARARS
jgi:hypothetical protein